MIASEARPVTTIYANDQKGMMLVCAQCGKTTVMTSTEPYACM